MDRTSSLRARPGKSKADGSNTPPEARAARRELHGRQPTFASPAAAAAAAAAAPLVRPPLLLAALLLLGALLLLAPGALRGAGAGGQRLPGYYALCSTEGRVYTSAPALAPALPRAQCVVVEDGAVLYVGSLREVRARFGDEDTLGVELGKRRKGRGLKVFRLKKGWSVIPGLIDAHAHPLQYGEARASVSLFGARSPAEVVERTVSYIKSRPDLLNDPDKFIIGIGWDQTLFPSQSFPTASDLATHALLVGRPIVFNRVDVHASWVSPSVLNRLGNLPEDFPGGQIVRGPDGAPTGVFIDNAMALPQSLVPAWTDKDRSGFLRTTASELLAAGMTGVHDAAARPADLGFYRQLQGAGRMPVRICAMVDCADRFCADEVERFEGDRLKVGFVKLFVDGALGSWGAALHEPYSDNPSSRGIMRIDSDRLHHLVQSWTAANFSVGAHAIGDRANTAVLDAFEGVINERYGGKNDARLRIEHAQVMTEGDVERCGRLGVIASMQPMHAVEDMSYAEARLGGRRIRSAYAPRSLSQAGAPIALGSDAPVSPLPALLGLHAAAHRTRADGTSPHGPGGWYAGERLARGEALRGFTSGAAFACGWDGEVGSLEAGKRADLVVLEGDVVDEGFEILDAKVRATVMDGRLVFGRV